MTDRMLYDGWASLKEGMDAATPPDDVLMLRRSSMSVNCTHRGGYPKQRPGWRKMALTYIGSGEANFLGDLFQGAHPYYPDNGNPTIVCAIGGRLYEIAVNGWIVRDISVPGADYDSSVNPMAWFWQSEKWLIKQNGVDVPVIWDGVSARRPASDEIATGTCGVYAWGRNWYARPDGFTYRATDLVRENGLREDVLKETANDFLNEGGDFSVPASAGKITAMFIPAALDNALGQGPVHVGTGLAVFSCNAPVDRTVWKDLTDPIQTVSLNVNGPTGQRNCVVHNGDVFYRAKDGVRSYILARREFGNWGNVPISREVWPFIANDNTGLLKHGSGVSWKNWLIQTCAPRWQNGLGCTHSGLVVLDFDLISTLKERQPPAWDGLWTGLDIHEVLTVTVDGQDRCFMLARSTRGVLELWEMDTSWLCDDDDTPIQWTVVGRQMDFGRRDMLKKIVGGALGVNDLVGEVLFDVDYKPDDYSLPVDLAEWSECAEAVTCNHTPCLDVVTTPPQYRTDMQLPQPADACNAITGQPLSSGYTFTPIVTVSGSVTIKRLRLDAIGPVPVTPDPSCGDRSCATLTGCGIFPYTHRADA